MTNINNDSKLCPIMSKPSLDRVENLDGSVKYYPGELMEITCQKERCVAWFKHTPIDDNDTFEGGYCRLIP